MQLRERHTHDHQARCQPGGVDEREEVARALERGGVVVVEEEAARGLDAVEGIEDRADTVDRLRRGDHVELVRGDDRDQVQADVGDVGVVADAPFPGAARARHPTDVIDREPVVAVGERVDAGPGVARDARQKVAVAGRNAGAIREQARG